MRIEHIVGKRGDDTQRLGSTPKRDEPATRAGEQFEGEFDVSGRLGMPNGIIQQSLGCKPVCRASMEIEAVVSLLALHALEQELPENRMEAVPGTLPVQGNEQEAFSDQLGDAIPAVGAVAQRVESIAIESLANGEARENRLRGHWKCHEDLFRQILGEIAAMPVDVSYTEEIGTPLHREAHEPDHHRPAFDPVDDRIGVRAIGVTLKKDAAFFAAESQVAGVEDDGNARRLQGDQTGAGMNTGSDDEST